MLTFLAKKGAMKLSGLESLSKDVFERRTPTGSVFFALFGSGFARDFEKIVCIKIKEPSKTNLVTSKHNKREKASPPLDVGRSETSLLKLPILCRIPEKITFNLFLVLESESLYLVKHNSECFYGDSLVINNFWQK